MPEWGCRATFCDHEANGIHREHLALHQEVGLIGYDDTHARPFADEVCGMTSVLTRLTVDPVETE